MLPAVSSFARGRRAKIAFVVDLVLLLAASFVGARASGRLVLPAAVATFVVVALLWTIGSRIVRHYDFTTTHGPLNDIALTSLLVAGVATAVVLAQLGIDAYDRTFGLGSFLHVLWLPVVVARLVVRGRSIVDATPDEVLVVGVGPLARHTALAVAASPERHVCGFLTLPGEVPDARLPGEVLGRDEDLERVLRAHVVDEVYLAANVRREGDAMQSAVHTCERFGVPFALPASSLRLDRARPTSHALDDGYVHFLTLEPKPFQLMIKRGIDIAASTVALVLLSPLLVGTALAIKLTSRGPVFFRQERVGQYGRHFHMLKFRSMVVDAEALQAKLLAQNERTGPVFKIKHDPRVTRVGHFIRKFSVDELPQLINVLRGEMTLVGPRPPIPSEVAKYEPWQRRRLSVRPGLTCLWQVSGRDAISFERWMYLDMQYIDHWSLRKDLQLILKTVPVVITGRGAS